MQLLELIRHQVFDHLTPDSSGSHQEELLVLQSILDVF